MQKTKILLVASISVGLMAVGCSSRQKPASGDIDARLAEQDEKIEVLTSELQRSEGTVRELESEMKGKADELARAEAKAAETTAQARRASKQSTSTEVEDASPGGSLLPPKARPGECYARVFVPPTYESVKEDVLKREAAERIEIVPAVYGTAEETVLVKDGSEILEIVPATYKGLEERVMVKPATTHVVEVPAVYETSTEEVLVKPAHTVWKKGRGPIEKVDEGTGEIMCLVEIAAEYKTITKRTLKSPATTRVEEIPAQYKTVKRQVLDQPATVRKVEVPAEYSTVEVQTLVSPPQEKRIAIPAEYQTVAQRRLVTEGEMAWRPVLCETNMTRDVVRTIQRALLDSGHDPGPIDGFIGPLTMAGVRSYQDATGLARGGLTMATLESLGVGTDSGTLTARRP